MSFHHANKPITTAPQALIVTNIPTPYRIALFNELRRQLKSYGVDLKVVFGALGCARRQWAVNMSECQFDYEVLPSRSIPFADPANGSFTYSGLCRIISRESSDVIISNGFSLATTKLWWRSWLRPTPYLIWSGELHCQKRASANSVLRRPQRKLLIRRAAGFIAYSSKAKEYLISMGAEAGKIQVALNTVDTAFYARETAKLRRGSQTDTGKKHLLYVGRFIAGKEVLSLLKSIHLLSKARFDFVLDLVGDGEENALLQKYVADHQLNDFIKFHGYKQKWDIPAFMARAYGFLFPTEIDIWGLVLNEAMAAGLPCFASVHAGATQDLIRDGITGFVTDFSQIVKVAEKLNWILDHPEEARQIGQQATRFIAAHASLEKSAFGFLQAIMATLARNHPGAEYPGASRRGEGNAAVKASEPMEHEA